MSTEDGIRRINMRRTSSCHSTRSKPVIISVTGCSTCSRVFLQLGNERRRCTTRPASVHFHEVEVLRIVVEDKLDCARADIVDSFCRSNRFRTQICSQLWRESWCWSLTTASMRCSLHRMSLIPRTSSMIFWFRLCTEQSLSQRLTHPPR